MRSANLDERAELRAAILAAVTDYVWDQNRRLTMSITPKSRRPARGRLRSTRYDVDGENYEIDKGVATSTGSGFAAQETSSFAFDLVGNKIQALSGPGGLTLAQYSYDADDRLVCTATRMNAAVYGSLEATSVSGSSAASALPAGLHAVDPGPAAEPGPGSPSSPMMRTAKKTVETRGVGTSLQLAYATYAYTLNGKESQVADANCNATTTWPMTASTGWLQQSFPSTTRTTCPTWNGPSTTAPSYEAYTYDNNDNLVSLRWRDAGVMNYCFDNLNREIRKDFPGTGAACSATAVTGSVFTTYDLLGHKLAVDYNSPTGGGVAYAYDNAGRAG